MKQQVAPVLLLVAAALTLLGWTIWTAWSAFTQGTLPPADWSTDHTLLLGFTWRTVVLLILLPACAYIIIFALLACLDPWADVEEESSSYWLVASWKSAFLFAPALLAHMTVAACFPSRLPPPLDHLHGGWLPGTIGTVSLLLATAAFWKSVHAWALRS